MSCNYSQETIGARRGPLDQYRYGWLHGGVRDKNSKVVLAVLEQRPLPQLPIFSPAVIWLSGALEFYRYAISLFRKCHRDLFEMRPHATIAWSRRT